MDKNKIKLYHYSNADIKDKIKVSCFGYNSYTSKDVKVSNFKRAFYYKNNPLEYRFKNSKYCYIVEIDKNKIYDLKIDKLKLIDKNIINNKVSFYNLFRNILKLGYIGILYNTGGIDIINSFKDLKFINKLKMEVLK